MRTIDETISVSGQIDPADIPALAAAGFRTIVNNRPDGEQPGQPTSDAVAAAAAAAGLAYRHIPVAGGFPPASIAAMAAVLDDGPVFAFCAAGTRSTYLWALAAASRGADADTIVGKAAAAGTDVGPLRPYLKGPAADR